MELLKQYIIALTNLYGIVSVEQVVEVYNQHNEEQVSINDVSAYLEEDLSKSYVYDYDEYFVHETVAAFDEFDSLMDKKGTKPHYVPEKAELLKYADVTYYEKPKQYHDLLRFVKKAFFPGDADKVQMLCENIIGTCRSDFDIQEVLHCLDVFEVDLENEEQNHELYHKVLDLADNVRLWEHNGHTRSEIGEKPMLESLLDEEFGGNADQPRVGGIPGRINFILIVLAMILWASMRNTPMVLTSAAIVLLQWYLRSVMAHRLLEPDKKAVREGIDRLQLRGAPDEEIQAFVGKTLEQQPSVNPNLIPTWLLVVAFLVSIAGVVSFFAAVYVRFFL